MKKLVLPLLAILFLAACTTESNEVASPDGSSIQFRSANKVDICHNGHIINVSVNAIPAHEAHGDAIDYDGDGFFSGPNNCGMPEDCNEGDPELTDNCCPSGIWCGEVGGFYVEADFNEDCSADIVFDGAGCTLGQVTWELLSIEGNVYNYLETDLCGVDQCSVTVTVLEELLSVAYACPGNYNAEGTLESCDEE